MQKNDLVLAEKEMGDVFFSLVNYARFLGINPENALSLTNEKFIQRFKFLEESAKGQGREITDLSLEQMNELWETSKMDADRAADLVGFHDDGRNSLV